MALMFHVPCLIIGSTVTETIQNSYSSMDYGSSSTVGLEIVDDATIGPCMRPYSNNYLNLYFTPKFNKANKFTIALWFCNKVAVQAGDWKPVFSLVTTNGSNETLFRLERTNTTTGFNFFNNGNATNSGGCQDFSIPVGQWRHITLTIDISTGKSNPFDLWVYNPHDKTSIHYFGVTGYSSTDSTQICYLKDSARILVPSQYIDCQYADIRVYSHRLSEYEIKELWKRPILHYSFDVTGGGGR